MMRKKHYLLLFLCVLGISVRGLEAQTIFSTFGPGTSYDTGFRYNVEGNNEFQAFLFVPTGSGVVANITVALGRDQTVTTATQFNLYAGTPTTLGPLLESFIVPNTVPPGLSPGAVVTFRSLVHPVLTAGQNYWLSFTEPNSADDSSSLWFFNNQGIFGPRLTHLLPAHTAFLPAFSIALLNPEVLMNQVTNLNLNDGNKNALISKLQAAQESIIRGNTNAARVQLNAFINQVQAFLNARRIDPLTAGLLIADAEALITSLQQ